MCQLFGTPKSFPICGVTPPRNQAIAQHDRVDLDLAGLISRALTHSSPSSGVGLQLFRRPRRVHEPRIAYVAMSIEIAF